MTPPRPRVLLVDDMEDNLGALEVVLRPLCLELVRASSGEQAMKALLRDDFALILMDVVMPGMDGFETAARIRSLDQIKDVPIIFLSAYDRTPDYESRGYSPSATDYLAKPFDPWVLRTKVEVFVDLYRKSQRQEADATVPAPGPATMAAPPPGEAYSHRPGLTQIMADLRARLGNLEATVLGLEGGSAGSSRCEPGAVVSEMSEQIRDLRMVADALSARFGDHAG